MKTTLAIGAAFTAVLVLSACNDKNGTPPLSGDFRAVNNVTDSNSSGMDVDISNISTAVRNITFGTASQISTYPEGSYDAQVTVNGVSFQVEHIVLSEDTLTTLFALGTIGNGDSTLTATGFSVQESLNAPPSGQFVVQYIDASASQPNVNVYVVEPETPIAGLTPAATLTSAARSNAALAINDGSYEIVVTDAAGTVLFDSGSGGVPLPNVQSGTDVNVIQIAIIDAPGAPDGSPVSLLVLDNDGGNTPIRNQQYRVLPQAR